MYLDQVLIADIISETSMGNESQKVNLKAVMKERQKKKSTCSHSAVVVKDYM